MKKTLYYLVKIRELGVMVNQGFIIVKIDDEELISLEGVFTQDYLVAEIENDSICFKYYSRYEEMGDYGKDWEVTMSLDDFELPLNLEAYFETEPQETDTELVIETLRQIVEKTEHQKCESILKKLKNNNVFI